MAKKVKTIEVSLPPVLTTQEWVILGLDLSISRTGFCLFDSGPDGTRVETIGSIKPKETSLDVWLRSSITANLLKDLTAEHIKKRIGEGAGFLLAAEAFTPQNDFLSSINRVMNTVMLAKDTGLTGGLMHNLYVNASTLRSVMGLVQKGATNKKENMERAYRFVDPEKWPGLDTDSCDAVLIGTMGVFATDILSGRTDRVPTRFLNCLCDTAQVKHGKKRITYTTKGLLHDSRYYFTYTRTPQAVMHRDAKLPPKKLATKLLIDV